jgi:hypothetical protein
MIFRLRFIQKGGHVHCRLFQAAAAGHTWQKNGELVFDEPGWRAFSALMWTRIEMLPEDDDTSEQAAAADARAAYDLFSTMRTADLQDLLAAHRLDMEAATAPETIAFSAGRQALIAAVLKERETSSVDGR